MIKLLKLFLAITLTSPLLLSQTIQANWECVGAFVEYTHVVREFDSPEDSTDGTYDITVSWPQSTSPFYTGAPLYTRTIKTYAIGDTVTVVKVPLINPELLALYGVAMNVDLNDDGTFTINEGSTYPTTEAENCSTFATFPAVAEDGTWTGGTGFTHPDDPNRYSMGWGISLSNVFAQFGAADLAGGTYGVDYGVGTDMENWGRVTLDYTDADHTVPTNLDIFWEAHDGTASGLGVNDDGQLNDFFGVFGSPGDTVTISNTEGYLAYLHPDTMLWYNLGWTGSGESFSIPAIGAGGNTVNPEDPNSYEIDPISGDTLPSGTVMAYNGYLFDPAGGDGLPFSGDEALAPTGYFLTYNYLEAGQRFTGTFEALLGAGLGLEDALSAAADSVASVYVEADTSALIGMQVGSSLNADYVACLQSGATEEQCAAILEAGPTMALMGVKQFCVDADGYYDGRVDDSGWDFDPAYGTGRLVFEVDNSCVVDNTTQRVNTFWVNSALAELDESAPIANKFELMGNYPNPFNPETKIKFSTERESNVEVTIYSLLGEKVNTIQNGQLNAGTYNISWFGQDQNGNKVPSGVYFYEVRSDNRTAKGKMLLLK